MTYLTFHLIFILPALVLLAFAQPRPLAGMENWRSRWAIPILAGIALLYTTPWDNYLVAREVWRYGSDRVIGTIGYVPVEEYLFFVLQPVLTGLFLYQYISRCDPPMQWASPQSRVLGSGLFVTLTLLGGGLIWSGWPRGLYAGLILAWASPVLFGMWLYGGRQLWRMRRLLLIGTAVPTLYLWVADAVAIRAGVWSISGRYTLGIEAFGLPMEEALFFLMTNLLIVKGILLLLFPPSDDAPNPSTMRH